MIVGRKFRTETARKRERTRVVLRGLLYLVMIVGVVAAGVYALHRPELRIQQVFVNNTGVIPNDTVASAIRAMMHDSYLHLIPKDSTFFLSTTQIANELRTAFPRIAQVTVQRTGMEGLNVNVDEREPAALWCGDVVPPIASSFGAVQEKGREEVWGNCYLVDAGGFIYAEAPVYTGNTFPRYYGSLEHAEPTGQNILVSDEFSRFQNLFVGLAHQEPTLAAVLIVDERDIELYLDGGIRLLALRAEVPDTIIRRVITLFSTKSLTPGKPIEYIDMRFDNKVFVKYVETVASTPVTSNELPSNAQNDPTQASSTSSVH
jgi:cell division septal protein FtsQ